MADDSEVRLYGYILDRLAEVGWDTKSPIKGGQVYTQNECLRDDKLKEAFGQGRPENVIYLGDGQYWVIEAKARVRDLSLATNEAKERADKINAINNVSCSIITGVAGIPDTTHYVETHCLVNRQWQPLLINNRQSTGFISPEQIRKVLSNDGVLNEYEINDNLFLNKISSINDVLHNGSINKRNRASVLASVLLALANDTNIQLNDDPTTLITDINTRAKRELGKYDKDNFFQEIQINLPTSTDNHNKIRNALRKTVEKLRDLNIVSAINSGRDVLGQCYEQFLKYANDAKEIGIVLTPRHITNMGADIIDVKERDIVFDPTCGTGGFLVSALDKVRNENSNIDRFKKGNLYGIEQDPLIATLAIINMVFRGDGNSNIYEGDCFTKTIDERVRFDKVLMNPPFALDQYEWQFVDVALDKLNKSGALFAVLPTTVMCSSDDGRGELTWRKETLKRHTLVAVIKLKGDLFYPQVSKGTYGVVIKAHTPHNFDKDKVVWCVLHDGVIRTKTQTNAKINLGGVSQAVRNYLLTQVIPDYVPKEIDCSLIKDHLDLSPEKHIGQSSRSSVFDIHSIKQSMKEARDFLESYDIETGVIKNCQSFPLSHFFSKIKKGGSGRKKTLKEGDLPLISTSEKNNGISAMVDRSLASKIYPSGSITISSNGSSCYAHHHNYNFAANSDVFIATLKKEFANIAVFICASINSESWRFDYYRKFNSEQLKKLTIKAPVLSDNEIDFKTIYDIQ